MEEGYERKICEKDTLKMKSSWSSHWPLLDEVTWTFLR